MLSLFRAALIPLALFAGPAAAHDTSLDGLKSRLTGT